MSKTLQEMSPALAEEIIEYRRKHNTSWEKVREIFNLRITKSSICTYCSKFRNGKLGSQRPKVIKNALESNKPNNSIDYSMLNKPWV